MGNQIRAGRSRQIIIGLEDGPGLGQAIPSGHEIPQSAGPLTVREMGRVASEVRTGNPSQSVGFKNMIEGAGALSACLTVNTAMLWGVHLYSGYSVVDETPYYIHEFTQTNAPAQTLWVNVYQADVDLCDLILYSLFDGFTIRHQKQAGPVTLEMPLKSTGVGFLKNQPLYDPAFVVHHTEEKLNQLYVLSTIDGTHSALIEEINLSVTRNMAGKNAQDGFNRSDQILYGQYVIQLDVTACVNDTDDIRGLVGQIVPVVTRYSSDDGEEWVEFDTPECAISEGDHTDDDTKVGITLESNAGIQAGSSSGILRVRNQIPDALIYFG